VVITRERVPPESGVVIYEDEAAHIVYIRFLDPLFTLSAGCRQALGVRRISVFREKRLLARRSRGRAEARRCLIGVTGVSKGFADVEKIDNRLNVIDFGGLFSGNAIGPPRSYALRLTTSF
jgi:hypothetical protein